MFVTCIIFLLDRAGVESSEGVSLKRKEKIGS